MPDTLSQTEGFVNCLTARLMYSPRPARRPASCVYRVAEVSYGAGDDPASLVQAQGLTRTFGHFVAVDGVDLEVQQGEVFALLGPNGAGKTTTIKMLITLLPPSAGRVEAALHFMGLQEAAGRLVRTYSGGMVRRLEIAQALIHYPRILFLDEPTIGLDPVARRAVWEHLARLRAEFGSTLFLTTHYMEEAESLATRIAIMSRGRVVALGTMDELKAAVPGGAATLEDVFVYFTGDSLESGGSYRETRALRRTARRLG